MNEKFLGAPYPITYHPLGFFHTQNGISQIKSDLLILLLTSPGERVMLPDFGTGLDRLIFDPNDPTIEDQARELIVNAITTWEPRIAVQDIQIMAASDSQEHVLAIKIVFVDPANISEVQQLQLEVPLAGN